MIDSKILKNKWVEPKKKGFGYTTKKGAPESVKRELKEFQKKLNTHRK